ncbi:DUF6626 family protein [Microcystis aeruginosa]|uniref:DUF6626 family protein n=1 Tax=Microcystis aeruginosa TaxID=1126 RepID=UPI00232A80E2|nr:DUF6626 family protein [Microcystis aeruginosa]MDB9412381.1 hypothetical protein [Microcystis aeruginosa CS-567/02]
MRKKLIMEAFDLLKSKGIVSSEAEFSEYWLAHSECYLRTLRMKKAEPSMGVVAICASRLQQAGEQIGRLEKLWRLKVGFDSLGRRCVGGGDGRAAGFL